MKTKLSLLSLVYLLAFVFACSDRKKETQDDHAAMEHASTDEEPAEAAAPVFVVSGEFQKQLSETFSAYVSLKDAFVATDAAAVDAAAFKTQNQIEKVDMKLLEGAAHNDWMTYQSELSGALKGIQSTDDMEKKRAAFRSASDALYKSIKAFGLGGATAFYEYCPMAFNNEGAYWLSDNSAILNPYFGDKMLKCGSVEAMLK
jgi:hypothetical protein